MGRSGAGRFLSSKTLTRTLTRFTLTRMRPRCAAGSCESVVEAGGVGWTIFPGSPVGEEAGAVLDVEAEDLGFCAQGGRSGLSCAKAIPAKRSVEAARNRAGWARKGVIDIDG